jgi:hypothetical protein
MRLTAINLKSKKNGKKMNSTEIPEQCGEETPQRLTYGMRFVRPHMQCCSLMQALRGFKVIFVDNKKCRVEGENPAVFDMLAGAFAGFASKSVFDPPDDEWMTSG